jgi:hypothetical protein
MLLELHKAAGVQSGLFGARDSARRLALMKTMDQLNRSLSRLPCASPQREGGSSRGSCAAITSRSASRPGGTSCWAFRANEVA